MNLTNWLDTWLLIVLANATLYVAAIGIITFLALMLGRGLSCQWRSGICTAGLMAILACPLLGGLSQQLGLQVPGLRWSMPKRQGAVADVLRARPVSTERPLVREAGVEAVRTPVDVEEESAREVAARQRTVAQPGVTPPAAKPAGSWLGEVRAETWVASAYMAGIAVMLLRLVIGQVQLLRLRWSAKEPAEQLMAMMRDTASRAGHMGAVRIGVSSRAATPMLVGIVRPIILLPSDMADLPESHIEAILMHEIAHIRRHDAAINFLQRVAEAMFFFHPVVWLLGQELRLQRERCCDAWVVARTGQELDYARCLTDLAERLAAGHAAVPDLAMAEFKHELPRRVAAVLDGSARAARALPGWAWSVILATALVAAGTASFCGVTMASEKPNSETAATSQPASTRPTTTNPAKPRTPTPEPWRSETGTVNVKVVNEDGEPVAGVRIEPRGLRTKVDAASWWGWSPLIPVPAKPAVTNAEGVASITYPKYIGEKLEVAAVTFRATHPDYCPAISQGYSVDGSDKLVLKKGATLKVAGYAGHKANTVPIKAEVTDAEATLDDNAWLDAGQNILVTHQLSAGKHYVRLIQLPQDAPARFSEAVLLETEVGREYTLELEIRPGVRVEGKLDASVPRPVHNGWILGEAGPAEPDVARNIRAYYEWTSIVPSWHVEAPIAEDGTFVLPSVPAGQLQLVGLCDGYLSKSSDLWHSRGMVNPQSFPIAGERAQVELMMEPSASCEVRVVNEQGEPVEGAKVDFWPNYRINGSAMILAPSGYSTEDVLRGKVKDPMAKFFSSSPYQGSTNAEGIAIVRGLPGIRESFSVSSSRYELPAIAYAGPMRRRQVLVELAPGKTTTITVTVQPIGKDNLADPLRPGETPVEPKATSQPASVDVTYCGEDPAVRADYVGKVDPEGDRTEFHGKVVDEAGGPIEGVLVDAWTWQPGNETHTDKDGYFQLKDLNRDRRIEVRFSKDGYTPRYIVQQPTGVKDAVVVLGNKTYFEGTVTDAQGQPVANALIRITPPPQRADGVVITTVWTEAHSDEQGHYRLYAQQGTYEFQVKGSGGVARRSGVILRKDEARQFDIGLKQGPVFRAKVVDTQTRQPVQGVKLYSYNHKDVSGVSGQNGIIEIADMTPGKFQFEVEAKGYARWWSAQCVNSYERYEKESRPGSKWQRNFDNLEFDVQPGMEPVTIEVEQAVRVHGKVVDPDGQAVARATVAPALTGTGNSLTGDTRFSVRTKDDGTFEMFLPAGNGRDYNLVAHDGKFGEWRNWANGVLPPIRTSPGKQVNDVVIQLTQPATVKGRVIDGQGKPVADRQVRANAFDKLENRYYNPETRTQKDGTFELKFVRPGKQYVQVAPFWLDAAEAPEGTSQVVTVKAGETVEGIELKAQPERR